MLTPCLFILLCSLSNLIPFDRYLCVFNALLFYLTFLLWYFVVFKFILFMESTVLHQIDISTVSYQTIFPLLLDFNLIYKILLVVCVCVYVFPLNYFLRIIFQGWVYRISGCGQNSRLRLYVRMPRDFPGGPVGRTLCPQCRGPRFNPWLESWIPHACRNWKFMCHN